MSESSGIDLDFGIRIDAAKLERALTPLWQVGYVPFLKLPFAEQWHYNEWADCLIANYMMLSSKFGDLEGYEYCESHAERVGYATCIRFPLRWDRIEKLAPWLYRYNFVRLAGGTDGLEIPLPFTPEWETEQ